MKGSTLTGVLFLVFTIGVAIWGVMLRLTCGDNNPNDLLVHLGESGATLAVLTVLGGLVRAAFDEHAKTQRKEEARLEFIRNILADFKSVYDRVESCRLLVEAHRSAKTYGEQVRGLVEGVVTLHNIKRALDPEFPELKDELKTPIDKMTQFLKELLAEFRENYKDIAHLQAADEAWNRYARSNLPKTETPEAYKPVSRAWAEIEKLEKLAVLRKDDRYKEYEKGFLNYLDDASKKLRKRLPGGE